MAKTEASQTKGLIFQLPPTDLLLGRLVRRAASAPAVIAVCRSCPFCPSMSAAAAGGAERLSG